MRYIGVYDTKSKTLTEEHNHSPDTKMTFIDTSQYTVIRTCNWTRCYQHDCVYFKGTLFEIYNNLLGGPKPKTHPYILKDPQKIISQLTATGQWVENNTVYTLIKIDKNRPHLIISSLTRDLPYVYTISHLSEMRTMVDNEFRSIVDIRAPCNISWIECYVSKDGDTNIGYNTIGCCGTIFCRDFDPNNTFEMIQNVYKNDRTINFLISMLTPMINGREYYAYVVKGYSITMIVHDGPKYIAYIAHAIIIS